MKKRSLSARVCAGVVCVSVATSMSPAASVALAVTQGESSGIYGVSTLSEEGDEGESGTSGAETQLLDLSPLVSGAPSVLWLDEDLSKPNIVSHKFFNSEENSGWWLTQDKDFEVVEWCASGSEHTPLGQAPTSAGYYCLKVKGIGSYKGESYADVQVMSPQEIARYDVQIQNDVWLENISSSQFPTLDVFRFVAGEREYLPNSEFAVDGWYSLKDACDGSSDDSYDKLSGIPTEAGGYYLRISAVSSSYTGYKYVYVSVRKKQDIGGYHFWHKPLWTDSGLDPDKLPLQAQSGDNTLENGTGFIATGWYAFEKGALGQIIPGNPSDPGEYYVRVEGITPYFGERFVPVTILDRYDLSKYMAHFDNALWADEITGLDSVPVEICRFTDSSLHEKLDPKFFRASGWYTRDGNEYTQLPGAPEEQGWYYIKIDGIDEYHGSQYCSVQVRDRYDLSTCWISNEEEVWTDGDLSLENLPLEVRSSYFTDHGSVVLERDTQYKISGWYTYVEGEAGKPIVGVPQTAGTYCVKLEGIAPFKGELVVPVTVFDPLDISGYNHYYSTHWLNDTEYPEARLFRYCYEDQLDLEEGTDYTVSGWYSRNDNGEYVPLSGIPTNTGRYYLKTEGIAPFKGVNYVPVEVNDRTDINNYYFYMYGSLWDDSDLTVKPTTFMHEYDSELSEGDDYTVSGWYTNNAGTYVPLNGVPSEAGQYYLKLTGCGSYHGDNYVWAPVYDSKDIENYNVESDETVWLGDDLTPANIRVDVSRRDAISGKWSTLKQGENYKVEGWYKLSGGTYTSLDENPGSSGTYYLKVVGTNSYKGEEYVRVKVGDRYDIASYDFYSSGGLWADSDFSNLPSSLVNEFGNQLKLGKEFAAVGWYARRGSVYTALNGTPNTPGQYYLKIKGIAPYSGETYVRVEVKDRYALSSYEFCATNYNLWNDSDFTSPKASFVEEYDSDGDLKQGRDYSASGWYTRSGNTYTRIDGSPTETGVYFLRVEGIGSYKGEEYVPVRVNDRFDVKSYRGSFAVDALWTDGSLELKDLPLDLFRNDQTKDGWDYLDPETDFKALDWYSFSYDNDNGVGEVLTSAPKNSGEYMVKVQGMGNYYGDKYVYARVWDPNDIGGYCVAFESDLTLESNLSDPELSVYRTNPKNGQTEYLVKGTDYEIVGWHDYDNDGDDCVSSPTGPGDWHLVLKGKGKYEGSQNWVWAYFEEPSTPGGGSGGGGSTAPVTPPATGTEVGEKTEGVVIGSGSDGAEGGSTTADVTVTDTAPATDSQGNAVDGSVSISNISSTEGDVVIPETVVLEGKTYLITQIPAGAMKDNETATSVTIPASVTTIGEGAFENCTSLTSVTIPAGVTEIQSSTFSGCSSLQSVEIEGDITSIAPSAFAGCESLSSVEIPASVTTIGEGAFSGCESLTSVSIPEGSSVGTGAFAGSGLTSVTIPAGVELGTRAFQGCEDLKSVTVEKDVEALPAYAFKGCASLKSVTIKSGVTAIERSAFSGCTGLRSLTLPKGVEKIGKNALYGAEKVKTLTVNSKDLTKASVKGALKGSSVTTVLVPKSMVSKYTKVFSKANCGKKVVVKAIKKRG